MADDAQGEGQVVPLPGVQEDWVRTWFHEVYNQLEEMASQLGEEALKEAASLVNVAYSRVYPPQVVRISTRRGPGERERVLRVLDIALDQGLEAGQQDQPLHDD